MHVGIDLIRLERYPQAIEVLDRCNQIDPHFEPGYCHRIKAYARLDDHDQAEAMFYLARQVQDECPTCCDHLAHSLTARGQIEKAIWCWQQTLRLAPDHDKVRAHLGQAHWDRGQLERANVLFEQQLTHNPDDVPTRLRLGRLQLKMERFAEATKTFRSVLDIDPTIALAHFHLGDLAARTGHIDEASGAFEAAALLDPKIVEVHHRLAQLELIRGRQDRARMLLEMEWDKPDLTAEQAIDLSRTMMDLGMMPQTIALMSRVIDESDWATKANDRQGVASASSLSRLLLHRGYAYLMTGHRRPGIADCRRSLRLEPSALAVHNLAMAYLEEGRLLRATYFLRRAIAVRPKDPMIRTLGRRIRKARLAAMLRRWLRRS
jgi:tetratricopeptide (TPR) repeat protein